MTAANLDQLRFPPVFRDVGTEEKREGFIFEHLVSLHTRDTYVCIKDIKKCISQ